MQSARIAIIGAGLSGLYAAYLLERQGVHDYVLLEARDVLGGRILSVNAVGENCSHAAEAANTFDRFDLGPTWFWPDYQRELHQLVDALGLQQFPQFEIGDMMYERSLGEAAVRMQAYLSSPPSVRLVGGMAALIDALRGTLDSAKIIVGHAVRCLRKSDSHVELDSVNAAGQVSSWRALHVLLALPPRLVEQSMTFVPALPTTLARQWRATATWMAPHAKYIAIYDRPFWRENGLSGAARSAVGPLGEIHDASMPNGSAALFGFFALPAHMRGNITDSALRSHCRAQLARLFGNKAATPKADFIKDWATDPYTATAADLAAHADHAEAPAAIAASGSWQACLTGIASEFSPQFPGYLAGAIEAAGLGVRALRLPVSLNGEISEKGVQE